MAKLFVAGFSKEVDEIAIAELFIPYGQINTIKLLADKETGKSLGYGFIEMQDQAGADLAVESLHGTTFNKGQLTVRLADNGVPPKKKGFPAKKPFSPLKKTASDTAKPSNGTARPYPNTASPYSDPKNRIPSGESKESTPPPVPVWKKPETTEEVPMKKKRPRLK